MPVCAFDIAHDGSAVAVQDDALTGPMAYRWWHFDFAEDGLGDWLEQRLPAISAGALTQIETRPRCDQLDDGLILNLRAVNMNSGQDSEDMVSLRLWVTSETIITVRLRKVFAVDDVRTLCENGNAPATPAAFIVNLVEGLTNRIEHVILESEEETDAAEEAVLSGEFQQDLVHLRSKSIKLRRYLGPQREALLKLVATTSPVIDDATRQALREPSNRTILVVEALDAIKDRLSALQDHTDSMANTKLGRNSYALSIIAAVFLPLGFLTGLFGVNVGGMPGLENPLAFAILSISMVIVSILAVFLLKKNDWL